MSGSYHFSFSFFFSFWSKWPKTQNSAVLFVYFLYKKFTFCLKMIADFFIFWSLWPKNEKKCEMNSTNMYKLICTYMYCIFFSDLLKGGNCELLKCCFMTGSYWCVDRIKVDRLHKYLISKSKPFQCKTNHGKYVEKLVFFLSLSTYNIRS